MAGPTAVNSPAARIVLVLPAMFALGDADLRTGTEARDRGVLAHPQDAEHRQCHHQLRGRGVRSVGTNHEANARINTTGLKLAHS